MRNWIKFLAAAIAFIAFVACGGGEVPKGLVGVWIDGDGSLIEFTASGKMRDFNDDEFYDIGFEGETITITIRGRTVASGLTWKKGALHNSDGEKLTKQTKKMAQKMAQEMEAEQNLREKASEGPQILGAISRMQHVYMMDNNRFLAISENDASGWRQIGFEAIPISKYFTFSVTSEGRGFTATATLKNNLGDAPAGSFITIDQNDRRMASNPQLQALIPNWR
jgi:hypothetical protein